MDARKLTLKIIENEMSAIMHDIEGIVGSPVVSYEGAITYRIDEIFLRCLELVKQRDSNNKISILLQTLGGDPNGAENFVNAVRYHFDEVTFIIDQYAMSAGTMIALSGNEIMMHYAATLGPIDPQIPNNEGNFVPATGYLHQYQKLLNISKQRDLTLAELAILQSFDVATLSLYESAIEQAKILAEKWLSTYKFAGWKTPEDRKRRANEIAKDLSDFKKWHSHSRPLGLQHLDDLGIQVTDYSKSDKLAPLHNLVREYRNLVSQVIDNKRSMPFSFCKDLIQQ